jgi:hypothetical protein
LQLFAAGMRASDGAGSDGSKKRLSATQVSADPPARDVSDVNSITRG